MIEGQSTMIEPYHPGEIAVQSRAGERAEAVLNGRIISHVIPAPARPFVGQQSHVAIGWLDERGQPWVSLVVGERGLASSDEHGSGLTIRLPSGPASVPTADLRPGRKVGVLFIELSSRRRLRVNGAIEDASARVLRVAVEQAFPNCPKYIQKRERSEAESPAEATVSARGVGVPPNMDEWLSRTDTAFVASVGPGGDVDCSHRGGRRGFMRHDGSAVMVPDYRGNSMFCTLGNMEVVPRAGLTLVDFESRCQLLLTGDTSVHVGSEQSADADGGTGRFWTLTPRAWAIHALSDSARWQLVDESPFNPPVAP